MLRTLGTTGLQLFPIGLGAMPLSVQGRPEPQDALPVVRTFLEAGGNLIDTANVYCLDDADIGHNERLIRDALEIVAPQTKVLLATKGGLRRPRGAWTVDGSPEWLRTSCEASLLALRVDCIELYQLHAVDPAVDILRSLDALLALQQQGKIRHIGLSNVGLGDLQRAVVHAPIISVQNRCHAGHKSDFHNGVVDFCRQYGITYIAHSPVGGHYSHAKLADNSLLKRLAAAHGVSSYRIVLAWLLAKGSHIIPIPGAKRVGSISDSMQAVSVSLSTAEVEAIDALPDD